jgi:hypothetical protein
VWQALEWLERAATFIINQHKVQHAWVIVERESDDQRHQQLRLAGPSAAGDHAVNTVFLSLKLECAWAIPRDDANRDLEPVGVG